MNRKLKKEKQKTQKSLKKQFKSSDIDKIIEEWEESAQKSVDSEVFEELEFMRDEVVKEIAIIKKSSDRKEIKEKKIRDFVIQKLKTNNLINQKYEDELYDARKFKLTREGWRKAIKSAWEIADKVTGAKAILIYCYSWATKHCELIPLKNTEAIFLYEEKREMFYLDRLFMVIDDKPVYFVLSGLIFSYELDLNIDGLTESMAGMSEYIPNFKARRKHLSSRAMYTIFYDTVLDRFAGYKPTLKDRLKQFILPFLFGVMSSSMVWMSISTQLAGDK